MVGDHVTRWTLHLPQHRVPRVPPAVSYANGVNKFGDDTVISNLGFVSQWECECYYLGETVCYRQWYFFSGTFSVVLKWLVGLITDSCLDVIRSTFLSIHDSELNLLKWGHLFGIESKGLLWAKTLSIGSYSIYEYLFWNELRNIVNKHSFGNFYNFWIFRLRVLRKKLTFDKFTHYFLLCIFNSSNKWNNYF